MNSIISNISPKVYLFLFLLVSTASAGMAQVEMSENLVTAQPGVYIAPYTLYPGNFQVEAGFSYSSANSFPGSWNVAAPNLLLRYGVAKGFEIRAATSLQRNVWAGGNPTDAITGTSFELKSLLIQEKGVIPGLALKAGVMIPGLTSEGATFREIAPNLLLAAQKSLGKSDYLFANFGISWDGTSEFPTYLATLAYEHAFASGPVIFVETYGYFWLGMADLRADAGVYWAFTPNMQVDFSVGVGEYFHLRQTFIGAGYSYRFVRPANR